MTLKLFLWPCSLAVPVLTPGRRQSKTPILSRNVDQKSIETLFSIAICRPTGDKWQSKTLFLSIFDPRSSIVGDVSIAAYPVWYWPGGFMLFVVLCPGTPEGSTGSGSGFKASQKTGQRLKVSSDRLGEAGNRTCDPWFTKERFFTTLKYCFAHSSSGLQALYYIVFIR